MTCLMTQKEKMFWENKESNNIFVIFSKEEKLLLI